MDIREAYQVMQEASGIKVGDTVKVLRTNISDELGSSTCQHTAEELERRGKLGIVKTVGQNLIIMITTSNEQYILPFFVLEVIEKAKNENMLTVNGKEYSESTLQKALQQYVNND